MAWSSVPTCGSDSVKFNATRRTWKCANHHAKREFSIKVGTICEDSAIGLDKWLTAMWLLANCKNGISSYEIARDLNVTQKTAWFMLHRIRLAMQDEFSEASWAVKSKSTKPSSVARRATCTLTSASAASLALAEKTRPSCSGIGARRQGSHCRSRNRKKAALQARVKEHVEAGSALYSDALVSYDGLAQEYAHKVVDHAEQYVDGQVHTNGLENFWSLLKRGIAGTYVSVEPFHLFRYLDEQMFRYNNRATKNAK